MPALERKSLMAGKNGLHLTHSKPPQAFLSSCGAHCAEIEPMRTAFGPEALRAWAHGGIGIRNSNVLAEIEGEASHDVGDCGQGRLRRCVASG